MPCATFCRNDGWRSSANGVKAYAGSPSANALSQQQ
jgi:hypothetical protein